VNVSSSAPLVRVEYLGFTDVDPYREFRFRLFLPEGQTEVRVRIATAAFGDGRVRLQDGPDVCYQKLLLAVAAGGVNPEGLTIDDADLVSHRVAHTKVARHRAGWKPPSPDAAAAAPRKPFQTRTPFRPPVAAAAKVEAPPRFQEGQRVTHAAFGIGVMTSSGGGHTVITFDETGPKRFITSMLEVEVLSAPHTWETGPRGKNRLCSTP
jgi:hypothetical protein